MLYFLHSTSVLSFYIDVVLTLSICFCLVDSCTPTIWSHVGISVFAVWILTRKCLGNPSPRKPTEEHIEAPPVNKKQWRSIVFHWVYSFVLLSSASSVWHTYTSASQHQGSILCVMYELIDQILRVSLLSVSFCWFNPITHLHIWRQQSCCRNRKWQWKLAMGSHNEQVSVVTEHFSITLMS